MKNFKNWVFKEVLIKKLNSPFGFIILFVSSLLITIFLTKVKSLFLFIPLAGFLGSFIVVLTFLDSFFAVSLAIVLSIIMNPIQKMLLQSLPFGSVVDIVIMINFFGCLSKQLRERKWNSKTLSHPIAFMQLIFFVFVGLQFFNVNMHSYEGYIGIVRRMPVFLALYFIAIYNLDSRFFLKKITILFIIVSVSTALYAFYQEFVGLADFEMRYLNSNEKILQLIFIEGRFRKFSLFNDPTSFGIFMAISGLYFLILSIGPLKTSIKIGLFICSIIMFGAMAFSGTRTAYAIVPAGIVMYVLMTITHFRTLIISLIFIFFMVFILYGPIYGNKTINRIRSTVSFSEDASLNVRDVNRAFIQPYIYDHPFGGGLATSGVPGKIYNPNHYLAGFPPDSAYLQSALEFGWIGLLLVMVTAYINLRTAIKGYYRSIDPFIKTYYLGFTTILFAITLAQYAQYALSFTNRLFYIILLACIVKTSEFDKKTDNAKNDSTI